MPATRVSQKLMGSRKGASNRDRNGLELEPSQLGSITLNRDAIQALTIAQAKVSISISAGGTTAVLVSEKNGEQLGGLDDLAKLFGLRAFVTKEKKAAASSDLQNEILVAAYHVSSHEKETNPDFKQKKLDNGFILAARPYKALADVINNKAKSIRENFHDGSKEYRQYLLSCCSRIIEAIARTLGVLIKGEKEKGKIAEFLKDLGVPTYVFNKLQMKSVAISRDMDLSRILFPQDPSKGLALTVAEWQSTGFLQKQGFLLRNSGAIIRILNSMDLVCELTGLSREEMANVEDPRSQRVLKTRMLVVPPFEDHNRVLEPLSRSGFRGFGLPPTAMDQSKDRLANLCAVFIRVYAFSVRMAETIPDFFDQVTPAGTIKKPDEKLGNYAKQMLTAAENGIEISVLKELRLTVALDNWMRWIDRECKIIPDGDLHKKIRNSLAKQQGGTPDAVNQDAALQTPVAPTVDITKGLSTGAEKDAFKSFKESALSIKDKGAKTKKSVASSVLSRKAKVFLKSVATNHSRSLADAMEVYFRGFYSEDIQSAAVRIAEARFDDFEDFEDEVGSSADDDSADQDSDDEDDI